MASACASGPSFFNSLKKDGLKFTILAVSCSIMGLVLVVLVSNMFGLPPGAAGGILAGSQTMSAAIGTAEMAVKQGAYKLPEGSTAEAVSGMIASATASPTSGAPSASF